ncbi:MAG: hypothetical protein NZ920_02545 [Aigarchaeota archaeon]|nr:hypothetical protein [Aigarchaeota archaeon]MDW8092496.1 hypothetical protein [Nitrososphaerota archaeon]
MSERRRIIIRKKAAEPIDEPNPLNTEPQFEQSVTRQPEQTPQLPPQIKFSDIDPLTLAYKSFDSLMERVAHIKRIDHVVQKVFYRMDTVDLKVVKKKIDEVNGLRSQLLTELGEVELAINEAISHLENSMAVHEEELFNRLVELESMREMEEEGKRVDRSAIERIEQETNGLRESISSVRQKIVDLQSKLDVVRSLPAKLTEMTTSKEVVESLYKDLLAKFKEESRIRPLIDKIMQDEVIPREYAVIYVWKKVFKPTISE